MPNGSEQESTAEIGSDINGWGKLRLSYLVQEAGLGRFVTESRLARVNSQIRQ